VGAAVELFPAVCFDMIQQILASRPSSTSGDPETFPLQVYATRKKINPLFLIAFSRRACHRRPRRAPNRNDSGIQSAKFLLGKFAPRSDGRGSKGRVKTRSFPATPAAGTGVSGDSVSTGASIARNVG
jgi:hypothetical protein